MKLTSKLGVVALVLPALFMGTFASAQTVTLGAANIPVLSGTTVPGVDGIALQSNLSAKAAYNSIATNCTSTTTLSSLAGLTLNAGVYCLPSSASLTGTLTLSGGANDVFIFQTDGALSVGTGGNIVLNGVSPNNVYFKVGSADIASGATFNGTILSNGNINVASGATLNGRALSINGTATVNGTINCTNCVATSSLATVVVNKTVINDDGGTATASSTALFVGGVRVQSGVKYVFIPGTYAMSEVIVEGGYIASDWSGSCTADGTLNLAAGANATCYITNNDVGEGEVPNVPTTTIPVIPGFPETGAGGTWNLLIALSAIVLGSGVFALKKAHAL